MEAIFVALYFGFWILFGIACIVAVIWAIFQRIAEKKAEDFEKRDN